MQAQGLNEQFNYTQAMEQLVDVIQQLSLARDLDRILEIVRQAARKLTGADGATFVFREGDQCHYVDEEAIGPLWKGSRFPMSACISGWVMLKRQAVIIPDIFEDPRIPQEAYRPTFVRSLAMVPIRTLDPLGAIGAYWAQPYRPSEGQVRVLQALADTTAVALENVRIYSSLEKQVLERTAELRTANEKIQQLLLIDDLTGLYNRRGFMVLATKLLSVARRSRSFSWVLYADLDNLKQTNDAFGHDAGDRLLWTAAQVLREVARESDVVARIGGDEFAIFGTGEQGPDEIQQRIRTALDQYSAAGNGSIHLSLSTGTAICETDERTSLEDLLNRADQAMYTDKRHRSGKHIV